jgi:phosphoribosyl-ATP pyrophosphohydrolase/phosphoribosyl-AMP cyclohydrolase
MPAADVAFIDELRFNDKGLIPAIAQDWLDGAILMQAWMNRAALELTLSTGEVHYWSRSRQEMWHKGATSGHIQHLKGFRYDCDADVLLLTIEQAGDVACHTGARSCFYDDGPVPSEGGHGATAPPADACTELMRVLRIAATARMKAVTPIDYSKGETIEFSKKSVKKAQNL